MKKIILFFGIFYCNLFTIAAQDLESFVKTNNAKESLQIAQDFINQGEFKRARRQLEHTLHIKPNFAVAYRELGKVLLELSDYAEASIAFEQLFSFDTKLSRTAYFECGEAFFKSNDIEKALVYYRQYESFKEKKYTNQQSESGLEKTYDKLLPQRLRNCDFILKMFKDEPYAYAINAGKEVNSQADEYLPTVVGDGSRMVFTKKGKRSDEDILTAVKNDLGQWDKVRKIGYDINTDKNEGMAKFAAHNQSFFFAGCERPDSEGGCDVYEALLTDGEVSSINRMNGLNSSFWDSQPSITCDGQSMYFSSTRPGGLGGADIWVSHLQSNGDWSPAINLGDSINTPFDEEAPYIASDQKTLYFTSDGHIGQGDGDLFISRLQNGKWTLAANMGLPFNSQCKELGFYVSNDSKMAYFASSRFGGEGGLDIYYTKLPQKWRPATRVYVEGKVIDATTQEPIETKVSIVRQSEKLFAQSNEKGWFFICLDANKGYSFLVEQAGYEPFMSAVFLAETEKGEVTQVLIPLKTKKTSTPPPPPVQAASPEPTPPKHSPVTGYERIRRVSIFFGVDAHELDELAKRDLQNVTEWVKESGWSVQVIGYADNTGNAEYNQRLSEKRANAVAEHLRATGVQINEIIQEGKGAVEAKTEDEKKFNRRVEVLLKKFEADKK